MPPRITITHIDTACILLDINGFKILTDPTLDRAGRLYHHGYGTFSRKTDNPALTPADLQGVDLILLSHHQHKDNFDDAGQAFARTVSRMISTPQASHAMPNVMGLNDWETLPVYTPLVKGLKITATPARHHPAWVPGFLAGKVIGFIIEYDDQPNGVIYISGDTVYFDGVAEAGRRYKIDIGIFHVGSVQFRYLTGFGRYTMDSGDLLKAVDATRPNIIIPIHHRGWTHFKESETTLRARIAGNPYINSHIHFLTPGEKTPL